jgi:hypothetical protein
MEKPGQKTTQRLYEEPSLWDIARKTAAYYAYVAPMPGRWKGYLREIFGDDYLEIEMKGKKPEYKFGKAVRSLTKGKYSEAYNEFVGKRHWNPKLTVKKLRQGKYLDAYEAFWGTWNRTASVPIKWVYRKCGGDSRPVMATMGAFTYSGAALHAMNPFNPYTPPAYALGYSLDGPEGLAITAGALTAFHILAGVPVAYSKWKKNNA